MVGAAVVGHDVELVQNGVADALGEHRPLNGVEEADLKHPRNDLALGRALELRREVGSRLEGEGLGGDDVDDDGVLGDREMLVFAPEAHRGAPIGGRVRILGFRGARRWRRRLETT